MAGRGSKVKGVGQPSAAFVTEDKTKTRTGDNINMKKRKNRAKPNTTF